MKLVIFIYSMSGGGAERVVSYLLRSLRDRNIDVHLVLMNETIKYDIPKEVPIHYLEKSRAVENGILKIIKIPMLAFRYAKLLEKIGATHSLSLLARPNYINTLSRKFTRHPYKIAISERNYPSMQYARKDLKSKINRLLIKKQYPKADSIICNSKASKEDLRDNFGCDGQNIEVIYNPIDKKAIDNIAGLSDFFDPHFFNVVSVGRLQHQKNHELIIRSIKQLKNTRLYILGQGHLEEHLKKVILEENLNDHVFLLGFDNNPYKYLKSADLFVLGSTHEGFPNVLLEAMACGLPILSTDCKSGPDEMMELKEKKNDIMVTDYGILVPINDSQLMAKGLSRMQADPEYLKSCKRNGLRRVLDFEKETILNEFIKVLENL